MAETNPRRLKGHKATATCCIASRHTPGLLLTTAEDGCVCWFDMRCKDVVHTMEVANEPLSSICFKSGNENVIYVSSGKEVKSFDVHLANELKPLETYDYNKEEINQIACNHKSSFLAAADDGGDVKINFMHLHYRVESFLRRKMNSVSGGLDSKLVMWDFSKGRPHKIVDFALHDNNGGNTGQCFNPAFIHAIAVPDIDMLDKSGKICTVARGDGVVDVIDIESELAVIKSKTSTGSQRGSQNRSKNKSRTPDAENSEQNGRKRLHLDYTLGGHTAAVSCVAFSLFGGRGKFIVSGGNDKSVKVWDWSRYLDTEQTTSSTNVLPFNINLTKKVNWLCTTPTESENLVITDDRLRKSFHLNLEVLLDVNVKFAEVITDTVAAWPANDL
ncbi:hypothetical protein TIFTF001_012706 [Ficus carica]|uniref:Transducin/WD40 repeat-like superfamily protein n=1 Tax=Ficus carica TaxID=3494 RepID=A0AA88D5E2_FICCA|nr:hypothetical protein TIFTF001_012706 [Ficus carica]